jgi:hypothetical protein
MWTALDWTLKRIYLNWRPRYLVRSCEKRATEAGASLSATSSGWAREEKQEDSLLAQPHVKINGPLYLEVVKKVMLKIFKPYSVFRNGKLGITHVFCSKLATEFSPLKCFYLTGTHRNGFCAYVRCCQHTVSVYCTTVCFANTPT